MKFKRLSAAILAGVMCFGVFSTTAFAYVDENAAKEEPTVEEKAPEKEPEEQMDPLTPDGNMTLVDDEGNTWIQANSLLRLSPKTATIFISSSTVMIREKKRYTS